MMLYIIIAFLTTFLLLFALLKTRLVGLALDQPNQRSLHVKAIPRTGGLAIMAGVLLAFAVSSVSWIWIAAVCCLIAVSLMDDIRGLPARYRLLAHLVVSGGFVDLMIPGLSWFIVVPLVLALGWMSNLYNFMDGSDGLAGGMTVSGFGFYAVAAYLTNDMQLALMAACIAAASLAFLCFNFHPARIFMGDAGSIPLGFMAGALGIYGHMRGLWPLWFPIALFAPFIVDASVTLCKRLLRGEKVWQAHRSHYYQRLVQMGAGHRNTALAEYLLMLLIGLSSVWLLRQPVIMVLAAGLIWAIILTSIMLIIDRCWEKFSQ